MTLVRYSASTCASLSTNSSLAEMLLEQMLHRTGHRPAPAEVRSWQRSLPSLTDVLLEAGLGNVEMLLEYQLPLTSKRADAVLAGRNPQTGTPSYVVVELKQWSAAAPWEGDPELVIVDGLGRNPRLHPVAQVQSYCSYLTDFASTLNGSGEAVAGAAYLHNANDEHAIEGLFEYGQSQHGRLFTGARRGDFIDFLRSRLDPSVSGASYADRLSSSAIAPSKQLLAVAADEVQRRKQFVLLAEQQLAYALVLHEVERARAGDSKSVVLVTGGPGSGKSVVALSLLGELARRGRTVVHATGSRSFTQTLRKVAGNRAPAFSACLSTSTNLSMPTATVSTFSFSTRHIGYERRRSTDTPERNFGRDGRSLTSWCRPHACPCSCSTSIKSSARESSGR